MSLDFPDNPNKILIPRPYQKQAIRTVIDYVKNLFQGTFENKNSEVIFSNAHLLEMATGSGKTFTVGKTINSLLKLRNRYKPELEGLNIVILTNRIDGLDQFRDDLFHRRLEENKAPIIESQLLENIKLSTFHSRADNLDDIDPSYFYDENTDIPEEEETFSQQNGKQKDNVFCSTFQTAILKDLPEKLSSIDLIIIDEAHNVKNNSDYENLIFQLSSIKRDDKEPLIIPVTATPSNITHALFGESKFQFGLAEYLASPYSPGVDYRMITANDADPLKVEEIQNMIAYAQNIECAGEKKEYIKEIESHIDELLSSYEDIQGLTSDLLHRIDENGTIQETLIFANGTDEADDIAKEINQKYNTLTVGSEIALSYHSYNDKNKALDKLKDPNHPCKVLISVGKLNESVDIPTVTNVVFWRDTNMARIFLQQFGRGLRGLDTVRFFDYVGSLKNLAWIHEIYEEYQEYSQGGSHSTKSNNNGEGNAGNNFKLIGDNIGGYESTMDLASLCISTLTLKKSILEATPENIFNTLWNYKGKGKYQESYDFLRNLDNNKGILEIEDKLFKFYDKKLISIKTSCNISSDGNIKTVIGFGFFLDKVFEGKVIMAEGIKYLESTPENILNTFWNYEGEGKIQESYNFLKNLDKKGIKEVENIFFEIYGKKIISIQTDSKIVSKGKIVNPSGFGNFIYTIFKEKAIVQEEATPENIFNTLWNYKGEGHFQESYDFLKNLDTKGIQNVKKILFKIYGKGLKSIKRFSKINSDGDIITVNGFGNFINKIFEGKVILQKKATPENILNTLWNYKGEGHFQESYDFLKNLDEKGIKNFGEKLFQIYGKKLQSIKTCSGIVSDGEPITVTGFRNFINKSFNKAEHIKATPENILNTFWNYNEDLSIQKNYDFLKSLNTRGIQNVKKILFQIYGKKLQSLKNYSGIYSNGDIQQPSGFGNFIDKVFEGKVILQEKIIFVKSSPENILNSLWNYPEKGKIQENYDFLKNLNRKGMKEVEDRLFHIYGKKINSIKKSSLIISEGRISHTSGFRNFIDKVFEEVLDIKKEK